MSEDSSGLNSEEEKMSLKRKILFPILKTVRYQINLATNNINNASHLSKGGLLAQTIFNPKLFSNSNVTIDILPHNGSELITNKNNDKKFMDVLSSKLLLYFHGGGFLVGSPETARPITTNLVANQSDLNCYSEHITYLMTITK